MIYRFDDFTFDSDCMELSRRDIAVVAQPQALRLLALLLAERHRLIDKAELAARVWGGTVSDAAIFNRVSALRRLLGDDGATQRLIRTVYGTGVRFVGDVRAEGVQPAAAALAPTETGTMAAPVSAAAAGKPSLALLPFRLLGDPGPHAMLADAIPDELIAGLARLRWLFVLARGSTFRFRDAVVDPAAVHAQLGARYVLSGSVALEGARLAIFAELADSEGGHVVWSESYREPLAAIHDVRADIAMQIVAAVAREIPTNEAARARLRPPETLDAWELFHLGMTQALRFSADGCAAALPLLDHAVALDKDFARGHAALSFVHYTRAFQRLTDDPPAAAAAALMAGRAAVESDARDPFAQLTLGRARWLTGDTDGGIAGLQLAVELAPSDQMSHFALAQVSVLSGAFDDADAHADMAIALSPLDPFLYTSYSVKTMLSVGRGEIGDAVRYARLAQQAPIDNVAIHIACLVAFDMAGLRTDADRVASTIRSLVPDALQMAVVYMQRRLHPPLWQRIEGALRRADL